MNLVRKVLLALLLAAVLVPCAFAEDEAASGSGLSVIDSVTLHGGFEFISMRGKFISDTVRKNRMTGYGFGIALELDLSEIPNFMTEGWYGYVDFAMEFSGRIMFNDVKYDGETSVDRYGFKGHLAILRDLKLDIPVDVRIGGGLAFNMLTMSPEKNTRASARTVGIALMGEGLYKFGDHFGFSLLADVDMSFWTNAQSRVKLPSGGMTINKHMSFGFGIDLEVMAGLKFIL